MHGVTPPGADNLMNTSPHVEQGRENPNRLTPQQCNLFKRSPMVSRITEQDREVAGAEAQ